MLFIFASMGLPAVKDINSNCAQRAGQAVFAPLKSVSKSEPCTDEPKAGLFFAVLRYARIRGLGLCPVRRLIRQSSGNSIGSPETKRLLLVTVVGAR